VSHQDDVFLRTFFGVMAGLLILAIIIYVLAQQFGGSEGYKPAGTAASGPTNTMAEKIITQEIKPVGQVAVAGASSAGGGAAATAGGGMTGEQIVQKTCHACHGTGVAGAPKIGDHAAWAERYKPGLAAMLKIAVHGKGAMPPRGGGGYKDAEMVKAIVYMLGKSGIKVPASEIDKVSGAAAPSKSAKANGGGGAWTVDLAKGKQLVGKVCAGCHGTGVAGAPKIGDHAAWAERHKAGLATMLKIAIHGKGAMPPRGGSGYNDQEMKDAIAYMLHESGISVK
jgi:cytochrome c5